MKRVMTIFGGFNRDRTKKLKQAYKTAVKAGEDSFHWEGDVILTSLAGDVLAFLAQQGMK